MNRLLRQSSNESQMSNKNSSEQLLSSFFKRVLTDHRGIQLGAQLGRPTHLRLTSNARARVAILSLHVCMSADFAPEIADNRIHFLFSKSASQLAGSNSRSSAPDSCCTVYSCSISLRLHSGEVGGACCLSRALGLGIIRRATCFSAFVRPMFTCSFVAEQGTHVSSRGLVICSQTS